MVLITVDQRCCESKTRFSIGINIFLSHHSVRLGGSSAYIAQISASQQRCDDVNYISNWIGLTSTSGKG